MKRNKCGLIIPLPQYYKTFPLRFIIFPTDGFKLKQCKEYLNAFVNGQNDYDYYRYIIHNMEEMMVGDRGKPVFDFIKTSY